MRLLLVSQPGVGHLNPLIGLGLAARRRGHPVLVACSEPAHPHIESFGLETAAAGLPWQESQADEAFPGILERALNANEFSFLTEVFFERAAEEMVPDLEELCRSWEPDLLVRNDFEFASTIVAERLGLPLATLGIEFPASPEIWQSLFGPQLALLRSRFGLSASINLERINGQFLLSCMPPSYSIFPRRLHGGMHFVQLPTADDPGRRPLPPWTAELPHRHSIFVTLGTIFNRVGEIFRTVIDGLADAPVNTIVAVGKDQDPARLGPLPGNAFVERYIPQSRIFPQCDLVISHGGFNTLINGLAHGLPPIVVPLSAHHPAHAVRCQVLGVGRALLYHGRFAEYFDHEVEDLAAATVRRTVIELLADAETRRKVDAMREEIQSLPDVDESVQLLETGVPKLARRPL